MKTLLAVISVLLFLSSVPAGTAPFIQWDASAGAEGYNVYCGVTPVVAPDAIPAGNVTTYDLAAIVAAGTQYECWVTATAAGYTESAHSNHIQFTPEAPIQTFVVPGQPASVSITWE